jgi:hypothetical protein
MGSLEYIIKWLPRIRPKTTHSFFTTKGAGSSPAAIRFIDTGTVIATRVSRTTNRFMGCTSSKQQGHPTPQVNKDNEISTG